MRGVECRCRFCRIIGSRIRGIENRCAVSEAVQEIFIWS